MTEKKKMRNVGLLTLTAFIWGIAFVAQSTGGSAVGSFSFNGIRSFIGAAVLIPAIMFLDKMGFSPRKPRTMDDKKLLIQGGICCGIALFVASSAQQLALSMGSPAGKAGFITACYILIVPILGLFLKKRCGIKIWIGVVIALVGLYLLCMKGGFSLDSRDLLLLLCSLIYSVQIMLVDYFAPKVDGVRMAQIEFFVVGVLSLPVIIFHECGLAPGAFKEWYMAFADPSAWIAIGYTGIFSSGVAYTLQIVGQEGVNPTVASMVMSLESVFSVLAGWIILHQKLSMREIAGCLFIFAAIVLAQI